MAKKFEAGQKIKAGYYTSVYKPKLDGWRSEYVEATLEVISPGKARVISAEMEQAGSKRQGFYVAGAESKEKGKVKIISKLQKVELMNVKVKVNRKK